jgi:hypothetical protein
MLLKALAKRIGAPSECLGSDREVIVAV